MSRRQSMVKILEFPTKARKAENILQQLEASSMQLEEMYDKLDSLHEMLHKAEEEASCMEAKFNEDIKEYAKYVAVGDIPVRLVQYASEANIVVDGDGMQFSFDWENTDET
jgi:hypothetical protein